jgi:hypothetical protein
MPLHEFHPICEGEIAKIPAQPGVYLLFQIQIPLHVDGTPNLRDALQDIKSSFPRATHFAVEQNPEPALAERVQKLRHELKLVRAATFVGDTQGRS